ncbi:MAG: hypothetical protein VX439_00650, partial [Candidatus Thermoplasmatota archaeon]|nr:hypothetical protein [Candidatus Thermoplasmatota archaeon]
MPGSWMADTSEEEEHPTVPLGINEMTIPRIALVMSVVTLSALLVMTSIIGWSVYTFLNDVWNCLLKVTLLLSLPFLTDLGGVFSCINKFACGVL